MSNESKKAPKPRKWLKKLLITLGILVLLVDVFHTGNIYYAGKWIACGRQPVIMMSSFDISAWRMYGKFVHVNFFTLKSPLSPFHRTSFFCSEAEAKRVTSSGDLNWHDYSVVPYIP